MGTRDKDLIPPILRTILTGFFFYTVFRLLKAKRTKLGICSVSMYLL